MRLVKYINRKHPWHCIIYLNKEYEFLDDIGFTKLVYFKGGSYSFTNMLKKIISYENKK